MHFALLVSLPAVSQIAAKAEEPAASGFVYVMTNRAEGNSVLVYRRASTGVLTLVQEAPTKGLGTGFANDPFMSQGSLSLSSDGKLLLAINAGSGELTALVVTAKGLTFGSKVSSDGAFPVSVTGFGGLIYVLNQLGIANITGFAADSAGHLQHISGSTRKLAGGALALPAQVSFTPDGRQLLITEKGTDLIDIFEVGGNGLTTGPSTRKSSGHTPFGFTFGPSDSVIVTEAERRLPVSGTTSSYRLASGTLQSVSPKVPDHQTAACWVTLTGTTAWVVNTGSSDISSYEVGAGGTLRLLNPIAASTGLNTAPIDLAASNDDKFVYVLKSTVGTIEGFRVNGNSLTPLFNKSGLPLSIQGIVAQ
jgi:6-phosphogluconolactonase